MKQERLLHTTSIIKEIQIFNSQHLYVLFYDIILLIEKFPKNEFTCRNISEKELF